MIGDRWGVSDSEAWRSYPCDNFVMRAPRWAALGLSVGDLIMARRQLLNLKQLAERNWHHGTALG